MNLAADPSLELIAIRVILDQPDTVVLFDESYFSTPQTSILYSAIKDGGDRLDKNLLYSRLLQADTFDVVGESTLTELFNLSYDTSMVEEYASELRLMSLKRKLQVNLYTLVQRSSKMDLSDMLGEINKYEQDLLSSSGVSGADTADFQMLLKQELDTLLSGTSNDRFIKTGFKDVDTLLGGLERSNLELIAGRPSMGKSALLIRFLLNMAKQGVATELVSFEMSNQQIARRILSMESGIPGHRLQNGAFSDSEKEKIRNVVTGIQKIPFGISYSALPTIADLVNHIRMVVRTRGVSVVGVDYVQLMATKDGHETQDLSNIARALKSLAKQEDIGIYLVSQLNRAVEQRKEKRPMLSDLRQSGGLEENADRVIFVYRPHYYEPQNETLRGQAEMIFAKNRNGPISTFNVFFDDESTNFYSL